MSSITTLSSLRPARRDIGSFLWNELKPKGRMLTVFNVVSLALMLAAASILVYRFQHGLGSVTNLDQEFPWGLWKGFNVMGGVALAGGAYVICFMVYVLGLEQYKPIVRVTVLNGFLAYVFYAGTLLLDLGRPWNVVNPIIGNSFGLTSVLFLVAWHFLLYMTAQLFEFSPAVAEWLGLRRAHRVLSGLTLGAVVFGITLSTLHQSGLGALYMMAAAKIHPLWYSEFIPLLFFVSSIFAGLSLVMIEGSISRRVFADRMDPDLKRSHAPIMVGLARVCGATMFVYLFLKAIEFLHGQHWNDFAGFYGAWYVVEVGGLVAVPMVLFLLGAARENLKLIRVSAILALMGVILNRLNISIIAFKWYESPHYVPSWMEMVVTVAVICAEIWVFRWVIHRMPVLGKRPAWAVSASH